MSDFLIELDDRRAPARVRTKPTKVHAKLVSWAQSILDGDFQGLKLAGGNLLDPRDMINMVLQHFGHATDAASEETQIPQADYHQLLAVSATGIGACPFPRTWDVPEANESDQKSGPLPWNMIYLSDETCLSRQASGYCLVKISDHRHSSRWMQFFQQVGEYTDLSALETVIQLVIIVSDGDGSIRSLLDEIQYTSSGLVRYHQIPIVMVGGCQEMYKLLERAKGLGLLMKGAAPQ